MFQRYLLSSIYRSPDDPAAEPAEPAADPVVAPADPPADPLAPEPVRPAPPVAPRWALERIGEETSKRQAAEEAARVATERAAALEEITRRLQAGKTPDPAAPPAAPQPASRSTDSDAVRQEAAQMVFTQNAQKISDAGQLAYGPRWDDAIRILNAAGANSTEFVASVMELDLDKAHKIMFDIAQEPERAAVLAKMSPTRRIVEITRMIMAADKPADPKPADPKPADPKPEPKPAAVSRAPAPKPVLVPQAATPEVDPTTPEGNEKMADDKDWERWYKNKYYKRA